MRSSIAAAGIFFAIALGAAAPACAQRSLGAIVSSVRDASNRPVSGALVVASGPARRDATTNAAGIVTIVGLPTGNYTVSVTHSGFLPYTQTVRIGAAAAEGVKVLNVMVAAQNFATVSDAFASGVAAPLGGREAPFVAQALTDALSANVLADRGAPFAVAGPALEGASLNDTRLELDGIPLAGGARSATALRGRSALALSNIVLVEGPGLASASLRDAVGGIVDYQTVPISNRPLSAFAYGYDSIFGSYGHARYTDTFGKLGVAFDAAAGQNGNDAAVLKARVDVSPSSSVSYARYENRASFVTGPTAVADNAPAYAAEVRTSAGGATLGARVYESQSDTVVAGAGTQTQAWRTNGFTLDDTIPIGQDALKLGYDRRVERYAANDGATGARAELESIATLRAAMELQLARTTRLELGDDLITGTTLSHRNDPQIALVVHVNDVLALRFAAGGAYATVPLDLAAGSPGLRFTPETSFGYRASADLATRAGDHVRFAAFALRRYDAFADLSQARSAGLELGFERTPEAGRVGVDAAVDFTRTEAFGSPQPFRRYADLGAQIADRYTKARLALTYRIDGAELHFGTTLLGANNSFGDRAATLGDLSLLVPVAPIGSVRFGIENFFGQVTADSALAPLYPPRELTLTLER